MSTSLPHVVVRAPDGARAVFTLAPETDAEQGSIDLTFLLDTLIASGLRTPHDNPEDGVPFGTFTTEGGLTVTVDGRALTDTEIAEAACSGFMNAIRAAIDHQHDAAFPASDRGGDAETPEASASGA